MKAKKREVMMVYNILEAFSQGTAQPIKFSYFIVKNKKKLKDEVDILKELGTPPAKYNEYDKRRAELALSLADKDDEDKPVIKGNSYSITENKEEFDQKLDVLKDEYEETIKEFDEQFKQYKDILEEELEFDGHAIKVDDLPEKIEPALIELFMNTGLLAE